MKIKKIIPIIIIVVIIGIIISISTSGPISSIEKNPVMNGSKTQQIGEYGLGTYNPDNITDKDLIDFYNSKVKSSKLNWILLVDNKNISKGIIFHRDSPMFEIGLIDKKDNTLAKIIDTKIIENNKIITSK